MTEQPREYVKRKPDPRRADDLTLHSVVGSLREELHKLADAIADREAVRITETGLPDRRVAQQDVVARFLLFLIALTAGTVAYTGATAIPRVLLERQSIPGLMVVFGYFTIAAMIGWDLLINDLLPDSWMWVWGRTRRHGIYGWACAIFLAGPAIASNLETNNTAWYILFAGSAGASLWLHFRDIDAKKSGAVPCR